MVIFLKKRVNIGLEEKVHTQAKIISAINDAGYEVLSEEEKEEDVEIEEMNKARKKMWIAWVFAIPIAPTNKEIAAMPPRKNVNEIMHDSPPVVSKNMGINAVASLLQFSPMVLVSENGKLKGVITKSDLLGKVYK